MSTLLRKIRKEKNLSINEIITVLGIKRRMYYYLESGEKQPSRKVEKRLERFFGIPAGELLAESDTEEN